jgi:DNA-binding transcriptional MocR family regulator
MAAPRTDGTVQFQYLKLAGEIENKVNMGVYLAGEKLPSIRKLHAQTGLSITTVYQAFIELEQRGIVEARQKSGYYVKPLLHNILPTPKIKRHRAVPKKVTINDLASSIVESMGDPGMLRLGGTVVDPELLPYKQLMAAVKSIPANRFKDLLTLYENPMGSASLRRQIAKRTLPISHRATPEDIVITNGCIEAVSLCLQAIAGPGETIVVESPTYPWILQVIEDQGMFALELSTDPETGVDLESFRKAVDRNRVSGCILIPNFHNPLGFEMPVESKQELVAFLNAREIPIIEDDIHGDLFFGRNRPRALQSFDKKGLVLYCSSFSKTLSPGLRIGWAIPGSFREKFKRLKLNASIATTSMGQHLVADFLKSGSYERHLRTLRSALKNQASNMATAVARYFPEGTRITAPKGGLTLWLELDPAVDGMQVFQEARRRKIAILPGIMCSTTKKYKSFIRISCGFRWSAEIDRGIATLGRIVKELSIRS